MPRRHYLNISPKMLKVMIALFEYRGTTIHQLLEILGYNQKGLTNMYRPIRELDKLGYITAYVSPKGTSKEKIYYLTSKGYSLMLEHLEIPYAHNGKGFKKDYGDFPYELYKPPSSLKLHHLLTVDFLITANKFKNEIEKGQKNEETFDFRDNRYAAESFRIEVTEKGQQPRKKQLKFRPDAELRIFSNIYLVEVDTGTERGKNISEKFEGYKRYFDYLTSTKKKLPSTIIFVSEKMNNETQKNRRWQTIANRFLEAVGDYAASVNLIYESIDQIHDLLLKEYTTEHNRKSTLNSLGTYITEPEYKGTKIVYIDKEHGRFSWGKLSISISRTQDKQKVFAYERADGYETRGWYLLWKFKEYMENQHIRASIFKDANEIVPVLYYKNSEPKPVHFFEDSSKKPYFDNRLYFKNRGEKGSWQTKELQDINYNPLIYASSLDH